MRGKISFVIAGDAVGKGRSRHRHVTTKAGKSFDMEYTPAKTRSYEQIVRLEYERQVGHEMFEKDAALAMKVTVYKQIPKSMTKKDCTYADGLWDQSALTGPSGISPRLPQAVRQP